MYSQWLWKRCLRICHERCDEEFQFCWLSSLLFQRCKISHERVNIDNMNWKIMLIISLHIWHALWAVIMWCLHLIILLAKKLTICKNFHVFWNSLDSFFCNENFCEYKTFLIKERRIKCEILIVSIVMGKILWRATFFLWEFVFYSIVLIFMFVLIFVDVNFIFYKN